LCYFPNSTFYFVSQLKQRSRKETTKLLLYHQKLNELAAWAIAFTFHKSEQWSTIPGKSTHIFFIYEIEFLIGNVDSL